MGGLRRLWRGETPLAHAFWDWAIIGALVVNMSSIFLFVLLIEADRPIAAFIAGHVYAVPFNVVAAVGVWRAADRYDGGRHWAALARAVSLVWLIALSVV